MITVELSFQDDSLTAFDISGHAMSRGKNQQFDLVCAAVSVLAITITNGITDILQITPVELVVADGRLRLVLPEQMDSQLRLQANALLKTLVMGLEQLADDYSKHVQIVRRRCTT
ncbi:MAG TPA: ribosomal-processing cysteine protease Prp [Bacillota bacterium]|nr:ribosomal-processing cysteine protease Prp [Bacillota bacterium]